LFAGTYYILLEEAVQSKTFRWICERIILSLSIYSFFFCSNDRWSQHSTLTVVLWLSDEFNWINCNPSRLFNIAKRDWSLWTKANVMVMELDGFSTCNNVNIIIWLVLFLLFLTYLIQWKYNKTNNNFNRSIFIKFPCHLVYFSWKDTMIRRHFVCQILLVGFQMNLGYHVHKQSGNEISLNMWKQFLVYLYIK
jgi:hypothetical protein